jgi:hypothetical protein
LLQAPGTRYQSFSPPVDRFNVRSYHTDNFCLSIGWGIRVGYASSRLLGSIATAVSPATGPVAGGGNLVGVGLEVGQRPRSGPGSCDRAQTAETCAAGSVSGG